MRYILIALFVAFATTGVAATPHVTHHKKTEHHSKKHVDMNKYSHQYLNLK